jgi:small nuclear ribonucleoprotein (snRNP)-like protein
MLNPSGEGEVIMLEIEKKVIVRFRDRRIVKGGTHNFKSNREIFHVTEIHNEKKIIEIPMSQLKAIFFVETLEKNRDRLSPEDFSLESFDDVIGRKVKITFSDGEVMYGIIHGYTPHMKGFFIFPADKESNNKRAFVIRESTAAVEMLS